MVKSETSEASIKTTSNTIGSTSKVSVDLTKTNLKMASYQPPSPVSFTSSAPSNLLTFYLNPPSRQVLSRKLAQRLLADLALKPYQAIHLSGCALGDAAAGIAGPLILNLATSQSLRAVYLSDIIATLMPDEALRSLSSLSTSIGVCKHLQIVYLSDNALGTRGLAACQQLIKSQPDLLTLSLSNTGLSTDSIRLLQDMLAPGSTPPDIPLQALFLSGNRIENSGVKSVAAIVSHAPQLQQLSLASVGAGSSAITTLAGALVETTTQLRDLDLSDCSIDMITATALARAISQQLHLSTLILADTDMGDQAAQVILNALMLSLDDDNASTDVNESADGSEITQRANNKSLPPLREINLAGNELTSASAEALSLLMRTHRPTLQVLDIRRNELGDEGIASLTMAMKEAEGVDKLALSSLRICENGVHALDLARCAVAMVRLRKPCELWGRDNPISDGVYQRMQKIFGDAFAGEEREDADVPEPPLDEGGEELDNVLEKLADLVGVMKADEERKDEQKEKTASSSTSTKSRSSNLSNLMRLFSGGATDDSNADKESSVGRRENDTSTSRREKETSVTVNTITTATIMDDGRTSSTQEETSGVIAQGMPSFRTPKRGKAKDGEQQNGLGENVDSKIGGFTISSRRSLGDDGNEENLDSPATPTTPAGNTPGSSANFVESARKLRESLASLSKEISDVASELQMPVATPSPVRSRISRGDSVDEAGEDMNDYLLVERSLSFEPAPASAVNFLLDVFGGLLVAAFVIILVLAIAQSQEESNFSYRRV